VAASDDIPGLGPKDERPRLNTAAALTGLKLSTTEGFVLSRIDGRASYEDICRMSSLDREETLSILRKLKQDRLILGPLDKIAPPKPRKPQRTSSKTPPPERPTRRTPVPAAVQVTDEMLREVQEKAGAKPPPAEKGTPSAPKTQRTPAKTPPPDHDGRKTPAPVKVTDEMLRKAQEKAGAKPEPAESALPSVLERLDDGSAVDPADLIEGHGLPGETKKRIIRLYRRLRKLSPHELLGVPENADKATLRRAFAVASKELHPDRHFGKDLGPFREKLAKIFAHITEAVQEMEKGKK
jgi:hypothetical protein